jgi:hypothetical protein
VTGVLVAVGEVMVEVGVPDVVSVGVDEVGILEDGVIEDVVVPEVAGVVLPSVFVIVGVLAGDLQADESAIDAIAAPPIAMLTRFINCRLENLVTRYLTLFSRFSSFSSSVISTSPQLSKGVPTEFVCPLHIFQQVIVWLLTFLTIQAMYTSTGPGARIPRVLGKRRI